jgi:hypothetical protein
MDVGDVFEQGDIKASVLSCKALEITGWLVIIGCELCVIRSDYVEPFENNNKVRLSPSDMVFAVRDSVLPLGGGKSFVFHRVRMKGRFDPRSDIFEVGAILLEVELGKYVSVDLSAEFTAQAKKKYPGLMDKSDVESRDWIDYFL